MPVTLGPRPQGGRPPTRPLLAPPACQLSGGRCLLLRIGVLRLLRAPQEEPVGLVPEAMAQLMKPRPD